MNISISGLDCRQNYIFIYLLHYTFFIIHFIRNTVYTVVWLLMPEGLLWYISETPDFLVFPHTKVSKQKPSSAWQFCTSTVKERGQRRMAKLVRADRKATVFQITTPNTEHADGLQHKTTLGFSSVSQEQDSRLQWAQDHWNWTVKDLEKD